MSRRRIIAAIVAAVLAVLGILAIASYVRLADQRAAAALDPVPVMVVVAPVAKGTAAKALGASVQAKLLPKEAVAQGAVATVADLSDGVASTDLVVGEQLLAARFVKPDELDEVALPKGLQEVSILLTAQRVYGGRPAAGDKVGILLSPKNPPLTTKMVLNKVLVTRVRVVVDPSTTTSGTATPASSKSGDADQGVSDPQVMVTLAVKTHAAEQLIWAANHGYVWLTLQNEDTDTGGSDTVTEETINP